MKSIQLNEMEVFYLKESLLCAIKDHDYVYHNTKITNHPDKDIIEKQKVELRQLLDKLIEIE